MKKNMLSIITLLSFTIFQTIHPQDPEPLRLPTKQEQALQNKIYTSEKKITSLMAEILKDPAIIRINKSIVEEQQKIIQVRQDTYKRLGIPDFQKKMHTGKATPLTVVKYAQQMAKAVQELQQKQVPMMQNLQQLINEKTKLIEDKRSSLIKQLEKNRDAWTKRLTDMRK